MSVAQPLPGREDRPWPQTASHTATMSIGQVLQLLVDEFPGVRISKLRFLEEQGLVTPQRTPSGYRKYSQADVERLRYVLTAQRDKFLPLRVIGEQLAAMDAGLATGPAARLVPDEEAPLERRAARARLDTAELATVCQVTPEVITRLKEANLLQTDERGHFDGQAVRIVESYRVLAAFGVDARHLRPLVTAVNRESELVDQVVAPRRARGSATARERAAATAEELAGALSSLHAAMLASRIAGQST